MAARVAAELLMKGQLGLELHYVDSPEAEVASKLADATSKLIQSLAEIDEAALRAGPILIVKVTHAGKSVVVAETISPTIRKTLDANPKLFREPSRLLELLQDHRDGKPRIDIPLLPTNEAKP